MYTCGLLRDVGRSIVDGDWMLRELLEMLLVPEGLDKQLGKQLNEIPESVYSAV